MKTEFRMVDVAKGHQTTYHVYVGETRVGRVGKTDAGWLAYSVKNKKLGEPSKTRKEAGANAVAQAKLQDIAERLVDEDTTVAVDGADELMSRFYDPVDAVPPSEVARPDAEEEEEIEEEITPALPDSESEAEPVTSAARAEGEDTAMSDRMHDAYESINSPDAFPATHETDATEQTDPISQPSVWARVKAWFGDA